MQLAQQIAKFPEECLKVDRASAYYATYDAVSMVDALRNEMSQGMNVIARESVKG